MLKSGNDEIGRKTAAGVSVQHGETGSLSTAVRHFGEYESRFMLLFLSRVAPSNGDTDRQRRVLGVERLDDVFLCLMIGVVGSLAA